MLKTTLRRLGFRLPIRSAHGVSIAAMLFWLLAGCSLLPAAPTQDTSALNMMPNLAGYSRTDVSSLQGTLANVLAGGAALTGNVEISALVKVGDRLISCYHGAGAFQADAFVSQSDPTQSGVILIINNKVVSNLSLLLSCANPAAPGSSVAEIQPCTGSYTLPTAGNSFQIMFVATARAVCTTFCN